ncbi:glycosyltransferase, partial [Patescibacteria group bacterium]
MNILIATGIYPPDIGGPATYSKLIARKLAERGHKVQILTYSSPSSRTEPNPLLSSRTERERRAGISFVSRKWPAGLRHFFYFLKVLKLGKKADIIYIQDPVSVGLPATLANLILKKKLFLKIVGDYSWEQQRQMSNVKCQMLDDFYPFKNEDYPLKIQILEKIQNWVARKANKIITPSFYLKNILTNGWEV